MLSFRPTAARRNAFSVTTQPGWLAVLLVCLCAPLAARAVGPQPVSPGSLELRSELDSSNAGSLRNTLWARRGVASVGLGVQAPMAPVSGRGTPLSPSLLVGVAVDTSPRSRLVLDTPLPGGSNSLDNSLNPVDTGREVRVGLVIKPADPLRNLRAGQLFKVELSGRSQVALRPRSGGVAVSYSSRF